MENKNLNPNPVLTVDEIVSRLKTVGIDINFQVLLKQTEDKK